MTFLCSICGERADIESKDLLPTNTEYAEGNVCIHNWIELKGFKSKADDINGEIQETEFEIIETSLKDEVDNNLKTLSLHDQINKEKNIYLASIDDYNEINRDLENIYTEIRNSLGLDVTLPEFKQVVMSMSQYDAKANGYLSLLNSKIAEKYSNLTYAKTMIAMEKILSNMANNLVERSANMQEDAEGDNNLKLAATSLKFYREAVDMMRDLRKDMVILEADRELEEFKVKKEEEKQLELTPEDIQKLLNLSEKKDS